MRSSEKQLKWANDIIQWIEGEYPIAYCQDGRISPQYVMDKIKERVDMRKEYCNEA